MADDETMSTEDLLEAFRRKKAQAAKQQPEGRSDPKASKEERAPERPTPPPEGDAAAGTDQDAPSRSADDRSTPDSPGAPPPRGPPPSNNKPGPTKPEPEAGDSAAAEDGPDVSDEGSDEAPGPAPGTDTASAPDPRTDGSREDGPEPGEPSQGPETTPDAAPDPDPDPDPPSAPEHTDGAGETPDKDRADSARADTPEDAEDAEDSDRASARPKQGLPSDEPVVDVRHRDRPPAPAPVQQDARSLAPMDPSLGLVDRLRSDDLVTRPAGGVYVQVSLAVVALGLTLLAVDRITFALQGNAFLGSTGLTWVAITIAAIGAVAAPILWFTLKERTVAIRFASSQADEWHQAASRVRLHNILRWVGTGTALAGPLVVVIATLIRPDERVLPFVYAGGVLLVLGAFLAVFSHFMHGSSVRNYIQTTVLWILEQTGVPKRDGGPAVDPEVGEVLRSLDTLLAQLPESAVQGFMQTPQAKAYLELMDSLSEA